MLLGLSQIRYGERTVSSTSTPLVKTKFKSTNNYLWDRCRYLSESDDSFYVKVFLDSGKFTVGHQVFIQKMDESRYESVEVVNTQTALLLAELNDQSHRVFKFSTFKN